MRYMSKRMFGNEDVWEKLIWKGQVRDQLIADTVVFMSNYTETSGIQLDSTKRLLAEKVADNTIEADSANYFIEMLEGIIELFGLQDGDVIQVEEVFYYTIVLDW